MCCRILRVRVCVGLCGSSVSTKNVQASGIEQARVQHRGVCVHVCVWAPLGTWVLPQRLLYVSTPPRLHGQTGQTETGGVKRVQMLNSNTPTEHSPGLHWHTHTHTHTLACMEVTTDTNVYRLQIKPWQKKNKTPQLSEICINISFFLYMLTTALQYRL